MEFFEKDLCAEMVRFVKIVGSNLKGVMNDSNLDVMLDLTYEHFYDGMKDMEDEQPERLDQVLTAHFVTKFILDVL
jgi:hypothetical protein